jgi:hypothetical protein
MGSRGNTKLAAAEAPFDGAVAQKYSDRAVQILQASSASELLPRLSQDSNYFECKWCPYHKTCFGGGL